eukprot:TRINITY_DN3119_c0_g1_i1.p1 TRINITY_DN3119_c0_g1~~TRINITY_DN3119_c0_g1_i1.p1  ORF type:complete len:1227 (-),score=287.50 TRINITY_DN3119_c0_g1_i1:44-3724(-)
MLSSLLLLLGSLSVALSVCPHQQGGLVSYSSWAGKGSAANNYTVVVPVGTKVLLDVAPGQVLNAINIYGEFIVADVDMNIDAYGIWIFNGGHLWLGSEEAGCQLTKKITITLFGLTQNPKTDPPLSGANKVIGAFAGGVVDIHGTKRTPTWTCLAASTAVGDTFVLLAESPAWVAGDEIVIASTDLTRRDDTSIKTYNDRTNRYNDFQDERRIITSISGNRVNFDTPLKYQHYGKKWTSPDDPSVTIDLRGEVGLLTRNIVIRGDITQGTTAADHWGGHIMAQGQCSLRIASTELIHMGQKDNLARYPIHMHLCGDAPDSYVIDNSIHDTFQRCVTIHGTNYFTVRNNVAVNSSGHCFFIEDGNEIGNVLDHNLGVGANAHTLLDADTRPAIFWITNLNNTWTDNVASGGTFGYWFALPNHPLAFGSLLPNSQTLQWNRKQVIGKFKGNKAHSSARKGLHMDDGLKDQTGVTQSFSVFPVEWNKYISIENALTLASQPAQWGGENLLEQTFYSLPWSYALIEDFTAYKCREHGIWGRGSRMKVVGAKLADNQIGAQFPGDGHIFENSIVVGETENVGNPVNLEVEQGRSRFYFWDGASASTPIVGYQNYDAGGPDIVRNVKFYDFVDEQFQFNKRVRKAGGITVTTGPFVLPPRNKYLNIGFINTPNHIYFRPAVSSLYGNWEPNTVSAVIIDADGSLTGQCGAEISYPAPILYTSACQAYTSWNAVVCPPGHKQHRHLTINDVDNLGIGTFINVEGAYSYNLIEEASVCLYRLPDHAEHRMLPELYNNEFYSNSGSSSFVLRSSSNANILTNTPYLVKWGNYSNVPPSNTKIYVGTGAIGDWVKLAIAYPPEAVFTFTGGPIKTTAVAQSLASLAPNTYYYDTTTHLLWLYISWTYETYRYDEGIWTLDYQIEIDLTADCSKSATGDCEQDIDPMTITVTDPGTVSTQSTCETGGNRFGGVLTVAASAAANDMVIFDETLDTEWAIPSWLPAYNYYITPEAASSGAASYKLTFSRSQIVFYRVNNQKTVTTEAYTHLYFKVKATPGRGPVFLGITAYNMADWKELTPAVQLYNPRYLPDGPLDDTAFKRVVIPLQDLGLGPSLYNNIFAFSIVPYRWEVINTTVYFDEFKLTSLTTSFSPSPAFPTSNINTNYNYFTASPATPLSPPSGTNNNPNNNNNNNNNGATTTGSTDLVPAVAVLAAVCVGLGVALIVVIIKTRGSKERF